MARPAPTLRALNTSGAVPRRRPGSRPSTRVLLQGLAGAAPIERMSQWAFQHRLRVLAYHEVRDECAFSAQIRHLVARYQPVSGREVIGAVCGGSPLPRDAVWVTFDDGHPTVVERAQPVLDRYAVPATMFVCPGLVDTERPHWWTVVTDALELGFVPTFDGRRWGDRSLVTHLKSKPDEERRAFVAQLEAVVADRIGAKVTERQVSRHELVNWVKSGHELGNHTWDHPCLDRCAPDEQQSQVTAAHEWLNTHFPEAPSCFAYPNGNWSAPTEAHLRALGYQVALGFDHRLTTLHNPLRMSRLRVSAHASLPRFVAILSGVHPSAYRLVRRIQGRPQEAGRPDLPTSVHGDGR